MLIRKLFKAEMAHEVPGAYTQRCHHLHGHSYKFELFLSSPKPNPAHMVADFKAIKEMGLNDFYDSFDHAVMLWDRDPVSKLANKMNPRRHIIVPFNPTAEMIAKACFHVSQAILETCPALSDEVGVSVHHVDVHETDTGYASFSLEDSKRDRFPRIQFQGWLISDGIQSDWRSRDWFNKAKTYCAKKKL